jgi:3-hydroxyacyl-CoA dehydrogenase
LVKSGLQAVGWPPGARVNSTHYRQHDSVAVLAIDNPPMNGISLGVRRGLVAGIEQAEADPGIAAIVIVGSERGFSAGADIREFGTPAATSEPMLNTAINVVESCTKPVIAAIGGTCMGGGFELALGCHFRVVSPGATIALPEVKLGLLPGAGGTQRLPRLIGLELALNMIASGESVPAEKLRGTPLFDSFVDGDLLEGALAFARKVVAEQMPRKRARDLRVVHPKAEAFLLWAKTTVGSMSKNYPAPLKCVEAVEASVTKKSFDDGMRAERAAFNSLYTGEEHRALRHVFFAERAAAKVAGIPESTPLRPIGRVGIVGAGTMGSGIAINFLNAGIPVAILETKQEALDRGLAAVRKVYADRVAKGKLGQDKAEAAAALLMPTLSYDDLKDADLVIEAVFEDMGVKEQVFRKLDQVCKPGAILASNTSTLDLDRIAAFTGRPHDVVGAHFFSPANVMKLLEVIRGEKTAADVLATMMQVARKIRKTAVISGVCDGFIGNRMVATYMREALFLLEEGASVQQIDDALEAFGMAMGIFKVGDLAGGDISWAIRKRKYAENPAARRFPIPDRLCEMGRFGQKSGAGFYRYEPGRREALRDPVIDDVVDAYRKEAGITPRKIGNDEIVQRCVYALVNEGARILDEGIAQRASDIDIVYIYGYGFPPWRGGPMLHADSMRLIEVVRAMRRFAANPHGDPAFWQPSPLLVRLAAEGRALSSWAPGAANG